MPTNPNPNRADQANAWIDRGDAVVVRVSGNRRPAHLRGIARIDWMIR